LPQGASENLIAKNNKTLRALSFAYDKEDIGRGKCKLLKEFLLCPELEQVFGMDLPQHIVDLLRKRGVRCSEPFWHLRDVWKLENFYQL